MFYITQKNWDKILGYAEEAYKTEKSEIGGMSVMVEDNEGDWILQEPVILKQEISGGNTVLDKDALAEYYTKQAMKMKKKNFRFCWWHSHHTMSAFWSSTDKTAIDEFEDGDFSFALVVNLKGEYKFRVSIWQPFAVHQDVDLEVLRPSRITNYIKNAVKKLCEKPTYGSVWKGTNSYGYSYRHRSMEDPHQEQLSFPITDALKKTFYQITQLVDDANGELTDGAVTYKEYVEILDELNDELVKEESVYKVNVIKETQKHDLLHILPAQLVVYAKTGSEVSDTYNDWGWGSI